MTLEEIKGLNKEWISVKEMASFLDCDPQVLRMQAIEDRESIDFLGPLTIRRHTKFWKPAVIAHFERLINA